jgi:hypothetical protein
MIINPRGTSGSGKTTIVRGFFDAATSKTSLGDNPKKPEGYDLVIPGVHRHVYIVGSYENVCGGCDGIGTQDEVCERVRAYAEFGHVVFEGLLVSASFARYAELDCEMKEKHGQNTIWAFLDTPLDVCLERINSRRQARGQMEPVNPENSTSKWHGCRRTAEIASGGLASNWKKVSKQYTPRKLDVRMVPYLTAPETVLGWLRER